MISVLRTFFLCTFLLARSHSSEVVSDYSDIEAPPHRYSATTPQDRFTKLMRTIETNPHLDRSSEKGFLTSLLKLLDIPVSSQILVYSTTSLQLRFITPSNPRAVYFNEDVYIGYIPGGRLEVVGIDPNLGAIFYIFDIPKEEGTIKFERSDRCMNCHAGEDTGFVPGLVVKSVIPGPTGGSLDAFRNGRSGHSIPLSERFGGWHITGANDFTNHWGNIIGRMVAGVIQTTPNSPGAKFDLAKYPVSTSDILAHLIHEHQVGFVNRAVEAGYRARTALHASGGKLSELQMRELDEQANLLTKYLLFSDEAALPKDGIEGDASYKSDFLRNRKQASSGDSLKDFNLKTRLFENRCSYMIYSAAFQGLPGILKEKVYSKLKAHLKESGGNELASAEKVRTLRILTETLPDFPR